MEDFLFDVKRSMFDVGCLSLKPANLLLRFAEQNLILKMIFDLCVESGNDDEKEP
jgi:hypothetical protein